MATTAPAASQFKHHMIGSVLLSNTAVFEAERSLQISEGYRDGKDAWRVCDLMMLIESVILNNQCFYLPAQLPGDRGGPGLRRLLIEKEILKPIPKGDDHDLIGKALLAALDIEKSSSFEYYMPAIMHELGIPMSADQEVAFLDYRQDWWERFAGPGESYDKRIPAADSFYEAAQLLISEERAAQLLVSGVEVRRSGGYPLRDSMLRTMYYIFTSEHYGVPFGPSVAARSVQQRFPNYFRPSTRMKIYEALASALRSTASTVAQEFEESIVFIPPFSTLVLSRASTPAEIVSEMLALRDEYSGFRKRMCELELEKQQAKSLNERMSVLRKIQQLGQEAARPFENPSQMKLDTALRYIPAAIDLATNPTNPTQWAKSLTSMPVDALLSWYRRRPVAKLIRDAKTIGGLPNYGSLLAKHFGSAVTSRELETQRSNQYDFTDD